VRQPLPARRSVRLPTGNYVSGAYLVTIVTHLRRMTLGRVSADTVKHSPLGALVAREIDALSMRRERTGVMESIVMPNHVHMVVWLAYEREYDELVVGSLEDNSLGSMIGGFKAGVTRAARRQGLVATKQPVWQRSFHEAILRTEQSIIDASRYVERNPELWRWDPMRSR
jgi:REP element-mobilizing transposase RayT